MKLVFSSLELFYLCKWLNKKMGHTAGRGSLDQGEVMVGENVWKN
jgi:hypothetical protein